MMYFRPISGCILLMIALVAGISCDMVSTGNNPDSIDWEDGEQIVPAEDQHLDEQVKAAYREDAEKLAVRYINKKNPSQTDIPETLINLLYNGLIHIKNADHPKAREVADIFGIHARIPVDPRRIVVNVSTDAPWMEAWRNGTTETGNTEMDALIEEFNLSLTAFNEFESTTSSAIAKLQSDRAINGYAIGKLFEEIVHIDFAGPDGVTDGNEIRVLFFNDRLNFTFEYGFGDCPAGCINRHLWHFNVYKDGTLEFVNEGGDPLPEN